MVSDFINWASLGNLITHPYISNRAAFVILLSAALDYSYFTMPYVYSQHPVWSKRAKINGGSNGISGTERNRRNDLVLFHCQDLFDHLTGVIIA